ncbi:shikimate kinase [Candidatus Saccharibacteria bacterium]|nr:shikimate kinase [Candidatus Saccharibacteria bacterium]
MKIVLTGFMGSGKSTVARELADLLEVGVLDMDAVLEEDLKMTTADFFKEEGEENFRRYEIGLAKQLAIESNAVIATGGGVVESAEAMVPLCENAAVVYLYIDFQTSVARVGDTNRPLMKDKDAASVLFNNRQALYQQYATITIDARVKTPEQIAIEIYQRLGVSV